MDPLATTVWQGIELRMPPSWEMTRYGLHRERGVCAFLDETRERMHVSWQRGTPPVDLDRFVTDLKSKALEDSGATVQTQPAAEAEGWRGLVIGPPEDQTTRAVRHFGAEGTLLEIALLWRNDRAPELEAAVLRGIRVRAGDGPQRWLAFGIAAEVPAGMALRSCRCLPGNVEWRFGATQGLPAWTIRRLAFPSVWLRESLDAWLRKQLPPRWSAGQRETRACPTGHPLVVARSQRLEPLRFRRARRWDYACLCPAEQRVYHAFAETAGGPPLPLSLSCACGPLLP
jgi:hypothetical protein